MLLYNTWAKVVPVESLSEGGKPDLVLDMEPPSRTIRGSYRPPTSTLDETSESFHSTVKSLGLLQASSADSDEVRFGFGNGGEGEGGRNSGLLHPYGRDFSGSGPDGRAVSFFSPMEFMRSVYDDVKSRLGNYRPVNQVEEIEKFITL